MSKILHVISGLGTGGAETMLVQLAAALRERGFSQHVVSVSDKGIKSQEIENCGIPVTALGVRSAWGVPSALFQLVGLVHCVKPNVIQGWMYHGDLFATLAHLIARVQENRALLWNIRASNTDQGGHGRLLRLCAWLSRRPDVIVANSYVGLNFHVAKGYRPRRSEVIPNGINTQRFRPDPHVRARVRSELAIAQNAIVVIHVARVNPMKDHATFLQAMAEVPQILGILVGAGTERLDLPVNVLALGLRKDVEHLYAASDIVVSTSAFAEGFSNVIAEGMSTGLVPITTDIGDARIIVGDIGSIVPVRDPGALAKELVGLSTLPALERQARGLKARVRIEEHFTLAKAADRFARLYAEC